MNIRSRSTVIDELALIASMWFADHLRNSTQSSVGDKDPVFNNAISSCDSTADQGL